MTKRPVIDILVIALATLLANGQTTRPRATAPTTTRAADAIERVELPGGAFYWLLRPPAYAKGDRAPLVVCLHGTDDSAREAIGFWSTRGLVGRAVFAAPQASGRGWAETDLARLRATWADLQSRVTFDPARVLLAGFSAGGAMAFHWLYVEHFPASAVATLANYLPPRITPQQIAERKHVPVFYGVGMDDINAERMRAGLAVLRENGVHVALERPYIGHTLSPEIGREALAWFDEQTRASVGRKLDEAGVSLQDDRRGDAAVAAEAVLTQRRWHALENVERAAALLAAAERWGRQRLAESERLVREKRPVDAVPICREVERAYAGAALAREARARREALEADPQVRDALADFTRRREKEAMDQFLDVQRLLAAGRHAEARAQCEVIVGAYPDTPAAQRARTVLSKLVQASVSPVEPPAVSPIERSAAR